MRQLIGLRRAQVWDQETLEFLDRIFDRSGLASDGTYLPPAIHPKYVLEEGRQPCTDLKAAAEEARMVRPAGRPAGARMGHAPPPAAHAGGGS